MERVELEKLWRDPGSWHLYFIYFCPRDPRIVVPKRVRGLGWTLNVARPLAVPFLAFLLVAIGSVLHLAAALHAGGDVGFDIKVFLALGVIALCYRLSNPRDHSDRTSDHENRTT